MHPPYEFRTLFDSTEAASFGHVKEGYFTFVTLYHCPENGPNGAKTVCFAHH